jgi:glycosyltransferase involved in cell wall biosynthesis
MKPTLLIVGPTPPPFHGVSVSIQALLGSGLGGRFRILHVDLADRRGIQHVDKPDVYDVALFAKQWLEFFRVLLRERPQVVYLAISQSTLGFLRDSCLIWPAFLLGSKLVLHLHGANFRAWYESRSRIVKAYVRWTLGRVTRIVLLGHSLRPLFRGLIPDARVSVVPNGIEWPKRELPPARPENRPRYRALHFGTLNRMKGTLVLLEAIARVTSIRQDVEFVLAGDWLRETDRLDAEALIQRNWINGAVTFAGPVEGKAKVDLFESADFFVFPGIQQEGQPLVVLEAMAAGLPVLFTNRGCLRETVHAGEHGLEVKTGDPTDLAEKILWLLARPVDMRRMGEAARRRYEQLYTAERFAGNMAEVFLDASRPDPASGG